MSNNWGGKIDHKVCVTSRIAEVAKGRQIKKIIIIIIKNSKSPPSHNKAIYLPNKNAYTVYTVHETV